VFIPLQASYDFDYNATYIVLEVITLILYFIDILIVFKSHKEILKRLKHLQAKENATDKHLWRSLEDEKKDLRKNRFYIVLSIVSWIPFSLFFWLIKVHEPLLLIYFIKIFRLLKFKPLLLVFDWLKKRALNLTRIVEMLFMYYVSCHLFACSYI
jgi:hypothetical protein